MLAAIPFLIAIPSDSSRGVDLSRLLVRELWSGPWGLRRPPLSRVSSAMTGLSAGPTNPRAAATLGRMGATLRGNIDKLDDIHLNAAARELAGEVVARTPSGRAYDHVSEVRSAIQGLRNVISDAERLLERGRPTAEQAEVAVRLRQQAMEALRRAEEALRQRQTQ